MLAFEIVALTPYVSPLDRPGGRGEPWSDAEVDATVRDYFEMLRAELAGRPYVKAEHARALMKVLDGRSRGAIERKHMNITAVLEELGYAGIDGYKPLANYQQSLRTAVEAQIAKAPWLLRRADARRRR